jgi:hypothetical protein
LNLSKCFWFLPSWCWVQGNPVLHTTATEPGVLQMTSEGDPTLITIPRIEPTSSFCMLGVYISPSGSNSGAFKVLHTIVLDYCTLVKGSHFTRLEALTSYIQYLLPNLCFQPPLLSLSQADCDVLTSMILQALLPKLHINRNTAWSIVFGSEIYGGLALPNLYIIQGVDKLRLFLGHLWMNDWTAQLIHIDMSFIQLLTGSGSLFINQDQKRFQWLEAGWLQSLWQFTSRYSLQFLYPNGWIPPKPRQDDHFLMELFQRHSLPPRVMRILNRYCLYLQVLTLSDITMADGKLILQEAKQGSPIPDRSSNLLWPTQGLPSSSDWLVWHQYLGYLEENGKLIVPLGEWISPTHQRWQYLFNETTKLVYDSFSEQTLAYGPLPSSRTLRSGSWCDKTKSSHCTLIPLGSRPASIHSRPTLDGDLFQILINQNQIPSTSGSIPTMKGQRFYDALLPKVYPMPLADLMIGETLHICIMVVSIDMIDVLHPLGSLAWKQLTTLMDTPFKESAQNIEPY